MLIFFLLKQLLKKTILINVDLYNNFKTLYLKRSRNNSHKTCKNEVQIQTTFDILY